MSNICIGYRLTVTRKDGTLLYTAFIGNGNLSAAFQETTNKLASLRLPEPRHDIVITLEGMTND